MTADEKDKMITEEILLLFEETFNKVEGFYLDKGTSLFESISDLSSEEASKIVPGADESIAGHIFHTDFYIRILIEYITEVRTGKTDWNESWIVKEVNDKEWLELIENLKKSYATMKNFVLSIKEWNDGDYLGGVLSVLVHCSLHLGHLRQLLTIIMKDREIKK